MRRWILILLVAGLVSGCIESEQSPQVWGRGDPPVAWRNMFGDDNIARLNFVQTNNINRNQGMIFGIDIEGVDGKPVHKRGLIERVTTLEDLVERVRKLEEKVNYNPLLYGDVIDPNK